MSKHLRAFTLLIAVLLCSNAWGQFYYGLHQTFGKNRVEYRRFDWNFYRYDRFDVYHYEDGQYIAQQVARIVTRQMPVIEQALDVPIDERIQVMVFNNLTELKQSNLNASDEESYNTGGVTHFTGTRIFVYFDGDYAHLEYQIREGLAGLALNNLMYGGFTQSLRNSTLLNLPEWFNEGLLAYLAYPYSSEVENYIIDGMAHDKYDHLYALTGYEARAAGHSLWNYIAKTYGENLIKNVIYTTVMERSIDKGLQYNLGVNSEQLLRNWSQYYSQMIPLAFDEESVEDLELRRSRRDGRLNRPLFSPDGSKIAYVRNRLGKYRVSILEVEDNDRTTVLRGGHLIAQNADYSYPLMAWHPNGKILAIVTEEKGISWLYFYNVEDDELEKREFYGFQKIRSITYSQDGRQFLLSAVKRNQSDIFLYNILSKSIKPLTTDGYTDLDPVFVNNDKFIVFRSNRDNDTLQQGLEVFNHPNNFDLFIYRMDKPEDQVLWRLNTPTGLNEIQPRSIGDGYFSYNGSTDEGGAAKTYMVQLDSSIAFVDTVTHYDYFIRQAELESPVFGTVNYDINRETQQISRVYLRDGRYRLAVDYFEFPDEFVSSIRGEEVAGGAFPTEDPEEIVDARKQGDVDIHNYEFEPEALALIKTRTSIPVQTTAKENLDSLFGENFPVPQDRIYLLSFIRDEFTVQIDNVFDYPQYQPFTGSPGGGLINTGFNTMFKVGAVDILNDYRMIAGFRTDFQPLPGVSLSPNSELFFGFLDQKSRWNSEVSLYRRSQVSFLPDAFANARYLTYEGHYKMDYPLSQVAGFRFSAGYRNQRQIILMDNAATVNPGEIDPVTITDYAILKASFVYDNTRKKGINLYHGTRYKIFTEFYENLSSSNSGMVTLGIDWRNYIPVHREIIWANRFAFGTSFGNELLLHYLGGVDNEFAPAFTNNTPYARDQNYAFQTVVTNMRGFFQNIRNGNSFAVINSELRVPIVKYLINAPIQNDFLANFQVIGFGDIGTAWNGLHPYVEENAINTRTVDRLGYRVVLDTQREPIVGGFGVGLRSRLLGYFCRVDWAWGVEDGAILDRVFYFSISTDF
ncbi:MAG: PD40 domain-containing protein [Flavobacteriia bacterium]|nr:PD40 domain-containing protein [Flavobacteriia bacterium]